MPRRNTPVKPKHPKSQGVRLARSLGAVDIHFHGAFGIDLMTADSQQLNELSSKLWDAGIAGFCPTTLSVDAETLRNAVARLGGWIRNFDSRSRGAVPLGIHLEGPFINTSCCGAHPPELIRKLSFEELESLWKASQQTLKIVTVAPETLSPDELTRLVKWAKSRKISLSLGHSKATEQQAREAFKAGFRGITHAWNALPFHQRAPGAIGAALGRKDTYIELIIDQVHVAPTVMGWTQNLQPADRLCFISDCVPAAATSGEKTYPFGPLTIRYRDGACRLENGALAGGGKLLTQSFCEWAESSRTPFGLLPALTTAPLWALQIPAKTLGKRRVEWRLTAGGRLTVSPIDWR